MLPSQELVPAHQSSQCNPIPSQTPTHIQKFLLSDDQLSEFAPLTGPFHACPAYQDSHLVPPNGLQSSVFGIIPPETECTTRPQKQIGPNRCLPDMDLNYNDVDSQSPSSQKIASQYSNRICSQPWGVAEQMSLIGTMLSNPQKRAESDDVYWSRISSLHRRLYPERSAKAVQDEWDSMHSTFNFITDWMRFTLSGSTSRRNWWNLDSEEQHDNLSRAKKAHMTKEAFDALRPILDPLPSTNPPLIIDSMQCPPYYPVEPMNPSEIHNRRVSENASDNSFSVNRQNRSKKRKDQSETDDLIRTMCEATLRLVKMMETSYPATLEALQKAVNHYIQQTGSEHSHRRNKKRKRKSDSKLDSSSSDSSEESAYVSTDDAQDAKKVVVKTRRK